MGDYTKLIVSCKVQVDEQELQNKINELRLTVSSYHSEETTRSIEDYSSKGNKNIYNLVLIGQTKYGNRQDEFLTWLEPNVVQGSGKNDTFAIQFDEYSDKPKLWSRYKDLE